MVTKSKLKMALSAEKGVDFKKAKQKKVEKERLKKKREGKKDGLIIAEKEEDDEQEEDEDEEDVWEDAVEEAEDDEETTRHLNLAEIDESDSDSSDGAEQDDEAEEEEEEEEEEDDEEEDIPISDLEDLPDEDKEDLIPHQRLTINNTTALLASLKRIALPLTSWPFSEHQSLVSSTPTDIPDISDDLNRELAFYKQALSAAQEARSLLKKEGVPFSRPNDYFAEMVKPDEHMEKIKARLVSEAADKKAAAEARKQRDLKKFGKQVQVAKLQERQKEKRETLEKIKVMKRKRQEGTGPTTDREADLFDVALDDEIADPSARDHRRRGRDGGNPSSAKRQKRDQKFGFGGKKRFSKSGDAVSSGDLRGFSVGRMKERGQSGRGGARGGRGGRGGGGSGSGSGRGGKQRLGKARRVAGRR